MRILGDAVQPPEDVNPALSHLFRLRKIQANIRRLRDSRPRHHLPENDNYNSSIKSALDAWRQDIPRYGSEIGPCGYLHPVWMTKLYDYSVLILMEEKRDFVAHDGTEDILSAIVEVCLSFRRLQEEGHVMCYTWSAVSVLRFIEIATSLTLGSACLSVPGGYYAPLHRLVDITATTPR